MFRKILVGPFGTEFDFPTLEQMAAVLLPDYSTFYLTAPNADGYLAIYTDERGLVTDWDKVKQEELGLEFSPKSKIENVWVDENNGEYTFTLCEDCE